MLKEQEVYGSAFMLWIKRLFEDPGKLVFLYFGITMGLGSLLSFAVHWGEPYLAEKKVAWFFLLLFQVLAVSHMFRQLFEIYSRTYSICIVFIAIAIMMTAVFTSGLLMPPVISIRVLDLFFINFLILLLMGICWFFFFSKPGWIRNIIEDIFVN